MKRTYSIEKYRGIIDAIRARIPDVSVTTDTIVGFCGETEAEFEETMQVYRDLQFDQAYMFAYSPRHSTVAWDWDDDVPDTVKRRRLNELINLQSEISRDKNRAQVGRTVQVLVEGRSDKDASRLAGRTRNNKLVVFPGTIDVFAPGSLVEVETQEAFLWGFLGAATRQVSAPNRPRTLLELTVV